MSRRVAKSRILLRQEWRRCDAEAVWMADLDVYLGTRDKARMSRKDPRKYKRRGGTKVGSTAKK